MNQQPTLIYCDIDTDVITALRYHFSSVKEVGFKVGNLLESATNIVISPANSYGFMDGGIDDDYAPFSDGVYKQRCLKGCDQGRKVFCLLVHQN